MTPSSAHARRSRSRGETSWRARVATSVRPSSGLPEAMYRSSLFDETRARRGCQTASLRSSNGTLTAGPRDRRSATADEIVRPSPLRTRKEFGAPPDRSCDGNGHATVALPISEHATPSASTGCPVTVSAPGEGDRAAIGECDWRLSLPPPFGSTSVRHPIDFAGEPNIIPWSGKATWSADRTRRSAPRSTPAPRRSLLRLHVRHQSADGGHGASTSIVLLGMTNGAAVPCFSRADRRCFGRLWKRLGLAPAPACPADNGKIRIERIAAPTSATAVPVRMCPSWVATDAIATTSGNAVAQ